MEIILLIVGTLLVIAGAFIYGAFAWGWVFWKFWHWFLLPVFPILPEVTLIQSVGLAAFLSLFKNHTNQVIKKDFIDSNATNILQFLAPPSLLLVGWLIKVIIL